MEFGAYYIPKAEWDFAEWLGLTYCARPILEHDAQGTGHGFVTAQELVNIKTLAIVSYPNGADEVKHPEMVDILPGSFVTIGSWEEGRNARMLDKHYQRGMVNYFLPDDDWLGIDRGVTYARRCADAWAGGPWTAVINANSGGRLDAASERGRVPTDLLLEQALWYRGLGATRILWWRYDTPAGKGGIVSVMERIKKFDLMKALAS